MLFGTSGLRGVFGTQFSLDLFFRLGLASTKLLPEDAKVCVGRDIRTTSHIMQNSMVSGLLAGGAEVLDCGLCTTPMVAYSVVETFSDAGIVITASHNPPEYTGAKFFDSRGAGFSREAEASLEKLVEASMSYSRTVSPRIRLIEDDMRNSYIEKLKNTFFKDVFSKDIHVIIDCGHGASSVLAKDLFLSMPFKATVVNDLADGFFPFRAPEPGHRSLGTASKLLAPLNADLLIAFDGDGDRFAVIGKDGMLVEIDLILAGLLREIVKRRPGVVVVSVNMSRAVSEVVEEGGGKVRYAALGKTYLEMLDMNGVASAEPWKLVDPSFGPWEDGVYSSLLLMELISTFGSLEDLVASLPDYQKFQVNAPCPDSLKQIVQERVKDRLLTEMSPMKTTEIDGIRLDFSDGSWVLIRPSGTEPKMRIYGEAKESEDVSRLREHGVKVLSEEIDKATG